MFGLTSLKLASMAGAALIAVAAAAYIKGRTDGANLARVEALRQSLEVIKERSETDAEVSRLGDRDLCLDLARGLPDIDADELCRMEPPDTGGGDGDTHRPN